MIALTNIADFTPAAGFMLLISLISVNSVLLEKNGIKVSTSETNKPGIIKWFYPVFTIFFLLFLIEITRPLFGFSVLPKVCTNFFFDSVFIRLTGVLTVFLSVFVLKTTLQHFSTSLRFGLNKNNMGKLITTGIFARSRNPFFMSLLLYFCGTTLIFPNLFFLIFAILAFTGIHFSILKEEKFLQKVYGE